MGAPKQKWTLAEEAALKAGVVKHGAGKWRTILRDPEYSGILYLRSNVDLKDKWRNMSVMFNGWGSRERSRLAKKHVRRMDSSLTLDNGTQSDEDTEDAEDVELPVNSSDLVQIVGAKRSVVRLDNLIREAITALSEPGGSNKTTIASYIEEQYWAPPNFKRLLSAKLKFMTSSGKLIKVKRKYRVAPVQAFSDRKKLSSAPLLGGRQRVPPIVENDNVCFPPRAQVDLEVAKLRKMSYQEAAAVAAQAVAEAEAAIAEAEEAARDADIAEADAEVAQAFAEAATKNLKGRNMPKYVDMAQA